MRVKNFTIKPHELRHPIEIQREVPGRDEDNRPITELKTVLKTKAKILNVRGEEFELANGKGLKIAKTFYIRFPKSIEITEDDKVLYKNKIYNIIYANNIEEMNVYLEIKTEYVK
ncbi:phage head closure protein [Clostridium perfringens]|uniref:phage head closure protein n=1 Tax=Clostridium perfringens TaxID=1502 RepID=UPI000D718828|nr:phage head closure protein [Clostridium perfringens]NGT73338.1 phage head closure protein [Clostridium perfringens]PWW92031.1 head-tail adaptor protein [Clostridium perfringens]PWW96307.1 head-tail adaptor protein [Clostridium perfringens]PWX68743.1 head-tail adaptor protein [Clostridium perfringens]